MSSLPLIEKYFPELSAEQRQRFERLPALYADWNERVNLISRQDIGALEERHLLHSLAIARFFSFKKEARILDLGTGGGFPGVPLAILFPEVEFLLIDGTGKKIAAVSDIIREIGLSNAQAQHVRAEDLKKPGYFDYVVTRAVAPLPDLLRWSERLISRRHRHAYPNGIIALKGGNLNAEISALPGKGREYTELFPISKAFQEAFFSEKFVVYLQS